MKSVEIQTFRPCDFATLAGVSEVDLKADTVREVQRAGLQFTALTQGERDEVILNILRRLDSGSLAASGEQRHEIWEKAWGERYSAYVRNGFERSGLVPSYMQTGQVLRLHHEFVRAISPNFEMSFSDVFRRWLFREYLGNPKTVYEFGCGSGVNLTLLAELFPAAQLCGLDWAESAVNLIKTIAEKQQLPLEGRRFDFFNPDDALLLAPGSAVVTMCALEQVGNRHDAFLKYLLEQRPGICLHMEPLADLYDANNLLDYLALAYHRRRNYLDGFLPRLRVLAEDRRIEILCSRRIAFGNLYHEGYSFVVWRPV